MIPARQNSRTSIPSGSSSPDRSSFGPNALDATFGPQVIFSKAPPAGGPVNLPPSSGLQFFGQVDIDTRGKDMIVALKDIDGGEVFSKQLHAQPGRN
jgi:alkaline phosphatase D